MTPALLTEYKQRVMPALQKKFGYANVHQIPKIEKVVVNTCVGKESDRKQAVEDAVEEIGRITGQKAVATKSKKAISNFKLRAGENIGARVTLRGPRMYEFLERLIKTAIPRIRDFRGVNPRAFDGRGNYCLGVTDQTIFPEIEIDKVKRNIGFDVIIVTSATNDGEARELLVEMGMPFRKPAKAATA
ncbi:MAG: 50S ribosomal protein L5 [Verrucomicrobiales bacterium]